MKLLLPIFGALIGAVVAIFFLGNMVGNVMMDANQFDSPDQASTTHAFYYLFTLALLTIVGFVAGLLLSNVLFGPADPWEQDPDYEP